MFDALEPEDPQSNRPTWEELETQLADFAKYICTNCNNAVKYQQYKFISNVEGQVGAVCVLVSNRQMSGFINAMIKCLEQYGSSDIVIVSYINRLINRLENYPS